jgi:hypothetical protein
MSDKDEYGHEEMLPTVKFVAGDVGRWEDMVKRLQERIKGAKRLNARRADELYKDETVAERVARTREKGAWHYEPFSPLLGCRAPEDDDVDCIFAEKGSGWCMYSGPLGFEHYGGRYVMSGTRERVTMCDACFLDGQWTPDMLEQCIEELYGE